jgi:hypothetical protein
MATTREHDMPVTSDKKPISLQSGVADQGRSARHKICPWCMESAGQITITVITAQIHPRVIGHWRELLLHPWQLSCQAWCHSRHAK